VPRLVPLPTRPPAANVANVANVALDLDQAWNLYDRQAHFVADDHLFAMFLGGVGSGKSHALTAWVVRRALANPGAIGALLGRTSVDLQAILIPAFFDRLQECQDVTGVNLVRDYDKGNAKVTLCNGCQVYFRPYNRIAKLRGLTLTFAAADEVEWSEAEPEEVWSVLTGRLRGRGPLPGLAFATSPNGLRGITRRFVDAQRHYITARGQGDAAGVKTWGRFYTVTATSFANPFLPTHFFDSLRSMSKRRYQQEVEGKVLRPSHTVLQLEARHMIPWRWQDHPTLPRVYGIDWGGGAHHVAIMCQVEASGRWVVADELILDDAPRGTFQDRLQKWIDGHGTTPPTLLAADRAAPFENQVLQTRYRTTPLRWMETKEDQGIVRGLELMRDLMDPCEGQPLLVFSDKLAQTVTGQTAPIIPAMRGYCYHLDAEGQPTTRPRKDNVNDHAMDALRYIIMAGATDPRLHGGHRLFASQSGNGWKPEAAQAVGRSDRQVT